MNRNFLTDRLPVLRIAPLLRGRAHGVRSSPRRRGSARAAAGHRPPRSSRAKSSTTISSGEARRRAAFRRARLHRAVDRNAEPRARRRRRTIGRGAVGRPELRARVPADSPRRLHHVPAATSIADVPFDRWRELNADGVIVGTVQKTDTKGHPRRGPAVQRAQSRQSAFARRVQRLGRQPRASLRTRSSDEIHQQQRALRGVARTKLTFNSDRDRRTDGEPVENRGVKEIYIADYDGENQRRVIANGSLNINSAWSPDGRSIAYTS